MFYFALIYCSRWSPYASQVVIVHKKTGDIHLCVDFHALNTVTIHDSFPLPRIKEALQAAKAAVLFTSFDLAQGYLQMAMSDADIHKTAFCIGSSGLCEFTWMPFGLSNAGDSFCCLMEMCLGDQQYLTLLFYHDDICVFGSYVDEMLDRIALVFRHLKEFNLKIKPKKSFFFQTNVLFLGHILSKDGISLNPKKISITYRKKDGSILSKCNSTIKENCHLFSTSNVQSFNFTISLRHASHHTMDLHCHMLHIFLPLQLYPFKSHP